MLPCGAMCMVKATEVTAGLAISNGSLPPGGWLKVTCWSIDRDQLRAQRSVTSIGEGEPYLFLVSSSL